MEARDGSDAGTRRPNRSGGAVRAARIAAFVVLAWCALGATTWLLGLVEHLVVLVAVGAALALVVGRLSRSRGAGRTGMWKTLTQWWKYLAAKLHVLHEERADPKVQLEQAITEAQEQDRRLREQATNVIANQQQAQQRLDRAVAEYEKASSLAEQALVLADQESRAGDGSRSEKFEASAASLASRVIALEGEIGELEKQLLQATGAADRARAAVEENGNMLQQRLAEKEQLLDKLDRARLQEQMNGAMAQLSRSLGADVPTFAEVEKKIETRLARAEASAEITTIRSQSSTDSVMREVEQAQRTSEADAWLSERRAKLGLVQLRPVPMNGVEASQ
jgi:phage shock protein A